MKKALLIVLTTMFVASYAYAGPRDYIGLFFDTNHSVHTYFDTGDFSVYYYVHAYPAEPGLLAVEFKIVFPPIVYDYGSLTLNPDIYVTLGDISIGWSAAFTHCQPGGVWVQVYRQRIFCDTGIEPVGIIHITETDDSQNLGLATCEMMNRPFTVISWALINIPVAAKETSWGAIKSLF